MDFNHYGVLTDEPMPENLIAELTKISHDEGFSVMAHANGDAGSARRGESQDRFGRAWRLLTRRDASHALRKQNRLGADTGHNRKPDRRCQVPGERDKAASCLSAGRRPKAAQYGAFLAPGSDAGAYRVFHGQGGLDELALLHRALGDCADEILARGTAEIESRF